MRLLPLLLLLALPACRDATAPVPFPAEAVTLDPLPAIYDAWWAEVEDCSGLRRPMAEIEWYYIPFGQSFTIDGRFPAAATWLGETDRIVLRQALIQIGLTVRHEMLHALLDRGGHPPLYFETRCGHLVS